MKHKMPASHSSHPNVTPLIDIVMCLIIFYMLVAKIGVNTGAAKELNLPVSFQGIKLTDLGNTITLNVMKPPAGDQPVVSTLLPGKGTVENIPVIDLSRTDVGRKPLENQLKVWKKQNPEFKVIIRADENLDYRFLEPVLLAAGAAQVKSVNFATKKPK
jgi:biopolymer transport protein ExbD